MMIQISRPVRRLLLPVAIAALLASCSTKASECRKLSQSVNEIRPIADQIQQEGKKFEAAAKDAGVKNDLPAFKTAAADSAKAFDGLIGQLSGLISKIQDTSLKDETLVGIKDRYVQNATAINQSFQATSQALTTISKIESSPKGLQELKQAANSLTQTATKMNTLVQEESKLITEFSTYCEVDQKQ